MNHPETVDGLLLPQSEDSGMECLEERFDVLKDALNYDDSFWNNGAGAWVDTGTNENAFKDPFALAVKAPVLSKKDPLQLSLSVLDQDFSQIGISLQEDNIGQSNQSAPSRLAPSPFDTDHVVAPAPPVSSSPKPHKKRGPRRVQSHSAFVSPKGINKKTSRRGRGSPMHDGSHSKKSNRNRSTSRGRHEQLRNISNDGSQEELEELSNSIAAFRLVDSAPEKSRLQRGRSSGGNHHHHLHSSPKNTKSGHSPKRSTSKSSKSPHHKKQSLLDNSSSNSHGSSRRHRKEDKVPRLDDTSSGSFNNHNAHRHRPSMNLSPARPTTRGRTPPRERGARRTQSMELTRSMNTALKDRKGKDYMARNKHAVYARTGKYIMEQPRLYKEEEVVRRPPPPRRVHSLEGIKRNKEPPKQQEEDEELQLPSLTLLSGGEISNIIWKRGASSSKAESDKKKTKNGKVASTARRLTKAMWGGQNQRSPIASLPLDGLCPILDQQFSCRHPTEDGPHCTAGRGKAK